MTMEHFAPRPAAPWRRDPLPFAEMATACDQAPTAAACRSILGSGFHSREEQIFACQFFSVVAQIFAFLVVF